MGTLVKKKIIYSGGSPQYYEMPDPSEDLLDTIVQYIGATDTNYTNGYFYKCVEVVPATNPKTYRWERYNVQPADTTTIDNITDSEIDTIIFGN